MKKILPPCTYLLFAFAAPIVLQAQPWDTGIWFHPIPTGFSSATPRDGKRYVIGGGTLSGTASNLVTRVNYLTQTPETAPKLPKPRALHSSVTGCDGKIYAIGGAEGPGHPPITNTVAVFDPMTGNWVYTTSMSTPRLQPAVAVASDCKIYVFGGTDYGGTPIDTVERYDQSGAWTPVALTLPSSPQWIADSGQDGFIYLFNGSKVFRFHHMQTTLVAVNTAVAPVGAVVTTLPDGAFLRVHPDGAAVRAKPPSMSPIATPNMPVTASYRSATTVEGHGAISFPDEQIFGPVPAKINSILRANWRFDGNSAGSASCGSIPATGTLQSVAGRVKQAADFTGANSLKYTLPACSIVSNDSFTVEFWLKRSAGGPFLQSILDGRDVVSGKYQGFHLAISNDKLVFQLASRTAGQGPAGLNYGNTVKIPIGEWVHIAVSRAASTIVTQRTVRLWINGAYIGGADAAQVVGGALQSTAQLNIGGHNFSTAASLRGAIDELTIHRKSLNFQEIRAIFLAGQYGRQ